MQNKDKNDSNNGKVEYGRDIEFKFDNAAEHFGPAIGISDAELQARKTDMLALCDQILKMDNRAEAFRLMVNFMKDMSDSEKMLTSYLFWDFRDYMARLALAKANAVSRIFSRQ